MTYQITICSNDETICSGYIDDRTSAWSAEIALEFVSAAATVINRAAADVDYELDGNFANWHGGKHTKFVYGSEPWGYSAGLVVCHDGHVPREIRDLCDAAEAAGAAARDAYIAVLEADAAEFERGERLARTAEIIAECRAADAS